MPTARWNCELAVGAPMFDTTNHKIFARLRRLAGLGPAEFAQAFPHTVAALERAFRAEEALMEQMDYPGLACHREQHARALSGLHHAAAALALGDAGPAHRAVLLVNDWLCLHITTMDRVLALALRMASEAASPYPEEPSLARPG
jgi:hemerythrin